MLLRLSVVFPNFFMFGFFGFFRICVSFLQLLISLTSSVAFFSFTSLLIFQASEMLLRFNSHLILSAGKLCIRNSTVIQHQHNVSVTQSFGYFTIAVSSDKLSSNTLKTYKVFRMLRKQSTDENFWT